MKSKVCKRCEINKEISEFDLNNRHRKDQWRNQCKECRREMHMIRTYGIGFDEYNRIYDDQRGRCAICGLHQNELDKPLYIDHDHGTGDVRGLLCMKCNAGLGLFNDDVADLLSAVRYLERDYYDE